MPGVLGQHSSLRNLRGVQELCGMDILKMMKEVTFRKNSMDLWLSDVGKGQCEKSFTQF
jgi:hypothetical protein